MRGREREIFCDSKIGERKKKKGAGGWVGGFGVWVRVF